MSAKAVDLPFTAEGTPSPVGGAVSSDPFPIVISASRRTDIPAFYLDWFMERVTRGTFTVENPYNRRRREVPMSPGKVHSVVFWSKNYGPFLDREIGERLQAMGFGLFFNFTLNSPDARLEPRVPPLAERLAQLDALAKRFGPLSVHWRHDPICFLRVSGGEMQTNLGAFETIAHSAADAGIHGCVTSFCDDYRKIQRRLAKVRLDQKHRDKAEEIAFQFPGSEVQIPILEQMLAVLRPLGMTLTTCCEQALLERLPLGMGVAAGRCIDHGRLEHLYGGRLSHRVDSAQRRSSGCGCHRSEDIGSYRLHPCRHNCLYCYANPA
jgi:hypothetical protein